MLKPLVDKLNNMRVVLASSSPQRRLILESTALKFEVHPSNFEENLVKSDCGFSEYVEAVAYGKMHDVFEQLKHDPVQPDIIIGVDTMVTFDGKLYGKPKTKEEAIRTITTLTAKGLPNQVYSGVVIKYKEHVEKFTEVTTVYMGKLTAEEVTAYVETGEPMGKAGGYGIQGVASTFVERIEGDYNNVIGLPLYKLTKTLKELICKI